ncbi:hypothetical protein KP509_11G086400 [Ceratopteris richardii]|uniref:Uncharacterized protein n=1 Tax=Ceratopteris richardii TaxID=49495 RepID=A0A8T2TWU9_CERRI|nr:hypothetical protein KP509_11G086400 [Ceratopteris richardii]
MALDRLSFVCCSRYAGSVPSAFSTSQRQCSCPHTLYKISTAARVSALVVDPSDSKYGNLEEYSARMEKMWLISKQPSPVKCVSCNTEGVADCQWCGGTGFFMLGDSLLCEVPSRNTTCLVCLGKGTVPCKDCKGTGYIARWLYDPSSKNKKNNNTYHAA